MLDASREQTKESAEIASLEGRKPHLEELQLNR
jgi:hypothetical protein